MNKIWGGNEYKNVNADTTPVYSGSSSGNHVVTPNTGGSSGGSSGKSGGSKKKKGAAAVQTTTAQTVAASKASGGGGGSSSGGVDQAAYAAYLKKLMKLSKKIYQQNMQAINDTYTGAGDTLRTNYDSTTRQLGDEFNYQNGLIKSDADDSMRQAYINSMLQKKDLGQKMSALGMSGGATETTLASMNNNYSNARNNIDLTRQRSMADLNQTYQGNLADALRQYNSAVSSLAMQRAEAEQAARNAYLQMAANYQFNPGSLSLPTTNYDGNIQSMKSYSYTPTQANNYVSGVSTKQSNSVNTPDTGRTNYATYLAAQRTQGANDQTIKNQAYSALQNGQISGDELVDILNQLGVQV